jgi:hypothetical protein
LELISGTKSVEEFGGTEYTVTPYHGVHIRPTTGPDRQ